MRLSQSRRDCGLQPKVGRRRRPALGSRRSTPRPTPTGLRRVEGVASGAATPGAATPLGLKIERFRFPRVGRGAPRAAEHRSQVETQGERKMCKVGGVSRILSRALRGDGPSPPCEASRAIIHLGRRSPGGSSALPAARRDGPSLAAYLGLPAVGFDLPRESPRARCALTAPFHPYLSAVSFLCHFPSGRPGLALPTTVPCPVRTFLTSSGIAPA
ncbi:MAG: hypothetical protein FLDDKLPJ_02768 [Phycisphaerae bacterium]|nr:hypothetical protein [Phycisphaerae bacterium]